MSKTTTAELTCPKCQHSMTVEYVRERDITGDFDQLATLLANIQGGHSNVMGGLPGVPGVQNTPGQLQQIADVIAAIGTLGS